MTVRTPTILYVDCNLESGIDRRRLDGLRRYAAARKWRVETLEHKDCSRAALRGALERLAPIGCAAECWPPKTALPPAAFGRVPVVYFEPLDAPGWRNAPGLTSDNAAVGRIAFEELSSTRPPAYAVVSCGRKRRWANERTNSFVECCRKAGADCDVAHFPFESAEEFDDCVGRMVPWVAALPHRCAVFAVNDLFALAAARAMVAAGRLFPRSLTLIGADGDDPPTWDMETAKTISSVRLDHEQAGYLAAKALCALAVNEGRLRCAATPHGDMGAPSLVFPPLLVDRRKSTRGYGRREPRILEAMEMIRREACDGLTVAKLAKRFPGTRRLFELRFREAAGHSALDEILNVRMARAMELLANTDMPVSAIANFCGFKTNWDFWKRFSKRTGLPPLRFRNARR